LQTAEAAHEVLRETVFNATEPRACSFPYALLKDILGAVQRAVTADEARAVIHTINKNVLQPAFQFQGEELALAKTALADLCSALMGFVSRTTDPAEAVFTVDKNETLNALLLAWDALHAVAPVSYDIDGSTGGGHGVV
jgi:hypothetical protein